MPNRRDKSRREPRDLMQQRVYVGVTGLAVVFLLTLLAASLLSVFGQYPHAPAPSAAAQSAANTIAPNEPLAELGVAPGNQPRPPAEPSASPHPGRPAAR